MACLKEAFLHGAPPCECCQGHDRDWAAYVEIQGPLEAREEAVAARERRAFVIAAAGGVLGLAGSWALVLAIWIFWG